MGTIKVSAFTPQTRELKSADPSGATKVRITPPNYEAEITRGQLLSKRAMSYNDSGMPVQHVEVNTYLLTLEEIWLTYGGTNLSVEIATTNAEGEEHVETVSFKPPSETNRAEFMASLVKLPQHIIFEWHAAVLSVVPRWANPF